MNVPKLALEAVEGLILAEQERQKGRFIEKVGVDEYIGKIKKKSEIFCHYVEGDCAGFVAFYCNDMERHEAYITLVLTNPRYRGMHIAKNLIVMTLASAKTRGFKSCALEVKNDNESAIALYESLGFSVFEKKQYSRIMKVPLI